MLNSEEVQRWLDGYSAAWKSYDPQAIGELFSEDAVYYYTPFSEPLQGRAAIVAAWLADPDPSGTYTGHYAPVALDTAGNRAVTNGRSLYFEADGKTPKTEFDNLFLLQFNDAGQCTEYREWYMERPQK